MLQLRPDFVQALAAHRVRRAQLLGGEAHAQLFQHPAGFLQPRIVLAFALGGSLPLLRAKPAQALREL